MLKCILLFTYICYGLSYYLTPVQLKYIHKILSHPDIEESKKNKVKKLLVSKYSWWAIRQAQNFQKHYKINPSYVKCSEMNQAALYGLVRSMKNYNGSVSVTSFSRFHIRDELYRCFTNSHGFGRFKHYHVMVKKHKPKKDEKVEPYGHNNLYIENTKFGYETSNEHRRNEELIVEALEQISAFDKRVFLLRYYLYPLKKKYTVKEIAVLMDRSSTTIRSSLDKTIKHIKNRNNCLFNRNM
tara:strand:- start:6454 stop:7176 length:723 start_codon:yes stop_codon:yes gene_type:complete